MMLMKMMLMMLIMMLVQVKLQKITKMNVTTQPVCSHLFALYWFTSQQQVSKFSRVLVSCL